MQLLIVPYGIEMNEILEVRLHDLLLIVPYGIEISSLMSYRLFAILF